ncbi:hypothetical protein [Umezawaea sp. Da 62-37]|uniref:hypothetical protein n=1 Tax=Umezawaea sp. Da 62-37 TaxID=3075927 RepID=UPI0028F6DAD4|nr:hypothetical protein [Umezawaea sp. Da 62-37]WNV85067.1 hypothetical protein RM788_44130 [Umezawaea sp. Da 62-37]
MTITSATPQAVQAFLDERQGLFRAFDHDLKHGVSANEIARMAAPAVSRPVVLAYLNAKELAADVHRILRSARLEGIFGADITGEIGRGARVVHLTLVVDPQEIERDQDTLVMHLADILLPEGIRLDTPEQSSIAEALWDGESVRLRRQKRQRAQHTGS